MRAVTLVTNKKHHNFCRPVMRLKRIRSYWRPHSALRRS